MKLVAIIIGGVIYAIALVVFAVSLAAAPEGEETENGFEKR